MKFFFRPCMMLGIGFFLLTSCSPKIVSYRVSNGMETVLLDEIDEVQGLYLFSHIKTGEVRSFSFLKLDADSLRSVLPSDFSIRKLDKPSTDTAIFFNGKLIERCANNDSFFHFVNGLPCYYVVQNPHSTKSSIYINNLSNAPIFIAHKPIYDSIYFIECSMCLSSMEEVFVPNFTPEYFKISDYHLKQNEIYAWLILKFHGVNPKVLTPYTYSEKKYFKYVSEFKKGIGEEIGVW